MENIGQMIRSHPFCAGMEPAHLDLLAGCGVNVHFPAGAFLFRQGEPADSFFLIRHGRVAVEISSPQQGPLIIHTAGAEEELGWSWLVPPHKWRFDGRALEDVRATALDGKCLRGKCERDPRFGYDLLTRVTQVVARRLDAARLQLVDIHGPRI